MQYLSGNEEVKLSQGLSVIYYRVNEFLTLKTMEGPRQEYLQIFLCIITSILTPKEKQVKCLTLRLIHNFYNKFLTYKNIYDSTYGSYSSQKIFLPPSALFPSIKHQEVIEPSQRYLFMPNNYCKSYEQALKSNISPIFPQELRYKLLFREISVDIPALSVAWSSRLGIH